MATSAETSALTTLYVGYFNRAPDPVGFQFWIDQIDGGREFNTIAADFAASEEAEALYPYLTTPGVPPSAFFTAIYANLFGRAPDVEGLAFWTAQLEDGNVSVGGMIEAIIDGAQNDEEAGTSDKTMLDNKVLVGLDFAAKAGNEPGFTYDDAAAAAAVAVLDGVTEDPATVVDAKSKIDNFIETGDVPGDVPMFTLDEARTALEDGNLPVEYNLSDTWDNISAATDEGLVNGASSYSLTQEKYFDRVVNDSVASHVDLAPVRGLDNVTVETKFPDLAEADENQIYANYDNASAGTTFGISNVAAQMEDDSASGYSVFGAGINVTGLEGTETLKLNLSDNAEGSYYSAIAKTVNTVSITSEAGNSGTIGVYGTTKAITVDGAGDLAFQENLDVRISEIDAGESTGNITFGNHSKIKGATTTGLAEDASITTGSGDDIIDLSNLTQELDYGTVTVDAGGGDDVITIGKDGSFTLTGGKGNDTFVFNGLNENTIIISDFGEGENKIDLTGVGLGDMHLDWVEEGDSTVITVTDEDDAREMSITLQGVTGFDGDSSFGIA